MTTNEVELSSQVETQVQVETYNYLAISNFIFRLTDDSFAKNNYEVFYV